MGNDKKKVTYHVYINNYNSTVTLTIFTVLYMGSNPRLLGHMFITLNTCLISWTESCKAFPVFQYSNPTQPFYKKE